METVKKAETVNMCVQKAKDSCFRASKGPLFMQRLKFVFKTRDMQAT